MSCHLIHYTQGGHEYCKKLIMTIQFHKGILSFSINLYVQDGQNMALAHYQTTNFRLFQTERVCRRQFQISRNERKLSKQVENTVGKGEIARDEQFLLFPQCFQKACFPGRQKVSLCENGLR